MKALEWVSSDQSIPWPCCYAPSVNQQRQSENAECESFPYELNEFLQPQTLQVLLRYEEAGNCLEVYEYGREGPFSRVPILPAAARTAKTGLT